jgi:hypothetical protein
VRDSVSVGHSAIFGPFLLEQFKDDPEPEGSVPVIARQFLQLNPATLIIMFRASYMKYPALHGSSFDSLQCSISLIFSMRLCKYTLLWSETDVFAPPLAEF